MASPRLSPDERALRDFALAYPEAHEDFPWGERVIKVRGKVFLFLGKHGDGLGLSVKLPQSNLLALSLPFASPTGYGLARGGWVTARFARGEKPPLDVLRKWIDESYRAVAPKRLVAGLGAAERGRPGARTVRGTRGPVARASPGGRRRAR